MIAKDLRSLTDNLRNLVIFSLFFLSLGWANEHTLSDEVE
jgi:hypothetical protein